MQYLSPSLKILLTTADPPRQYDTNKYCCVAIERFYKEDHSRRKKKYIECLFFIQIVICARSSVFGGQRDVNIAIILVNLPGPF